MIPESRQAAVERALIQLFGAPNVEEVTPLAGGLSTALVVRIVVRGRPYLLRMIMPGTPAGSDPARQFACMSRAADAGIAPRVLYTSVDDQLMLTDFVEPKPFPADIAARIAPVLRRLHALDGFPRTIDYLEAMDGSVRRFQTAQLVPDRLSGTFFREYEAVRDVYPRGDFVACHNDLRSENILFDGERIWLIDWEAAFLNDRFADLAWASTFFVHDRASERAYLDAYFEGSADEYARARFHLMRVLMHVFAAAFLLQVAAKAGASIDPDADLPNFGEFHRRLIARDIPLAEAGAKRDYGLVHFREGLAEMASERFRTALEIVRDGER